MRKAITPERETSTIRLELVRTSGGTQPRAALNEETVAEYADAMTEGAQFPPVVLYFDGSSYWLADGFHRYHAARRAGFLEIEAEVRQGTRRDAVLCAVGANSAHGLRRTNADKRRAVETLLRDEEWGTWSDNEIARQCNVDHKTVANLREHLGISQDTERMAERGGVRYTVNTENIGARQKPDPDPEPEPCPVPVIRHSYPLPEPAPAPVASVTPETLKGETAPSPAPAAAPVSGESCAVCGFDFSPALVEAGEYMLCPTCAAVVEGMAHSAALLERWQRESGFWLRETYERACRLARETD